MCSQGAKKPVWLLFCGCSPVLHVHHLREKQQHPRQEKGKKKHMASTVNTNIQNLLKIIARTNCSWPDLVPAGLVCRANTGKLTRKQTERQEGVSLYLSGTSPRSSWCLIASEKTKPCRRSRASAAEETYSGTLSKRQRVRGKNQLPATSTPIG